MTNGGLQKSMPALLATNDIITAKPIKSIAMN